jgi:hypothetical protein
MFFRLTKAAVCLFLSAGILTISASAEPIVVPQIREIATPITYQWEGDNGFTGFITLDGAGFTSFDPEVEISQSKLTAFFFSGPGFTFSDFVVASTPEPAYGVIVLA